MTRKVLLFSMLFLSVLLFGCVQGSENRAADNLDNAIDRNQGNLNAKSWSELSNLNRSIECSAKVTTDSTLNIRMYLLGEKLRQDITIEDVSTTIITKNNAIYMSNLPDKDQREIGLENCAWLKFDKSRSEPIEDQYAAFQMFKEQDIGDYTCAYSDFREDKFNTQGGECNPAQIAAQQEAQIETIE